MRTRIGPVRQRALSVLGSRHRIRGTAERDKERVALRIDLDAVVRRERGPQTAAMLVQRVAVTVAELLQQPRRALDIREEQRDDTRREVPRHGKNPTPRPRLFLSGSGSGLLLCPRQESNLCTRFRKPLLYPLSYGGLFANGTSTSS